MKPARCREASEAGATCTHRLVGHVKLLKRAGGALSGILRHLAYEKYRIARTLSRPANAQADFAFGVLFQLFGEWIENALKIGA